MNLNEINTTHPDVLRQAGHHQTRTGLLYSPPSIPFRLGATETVVQNNHALTVVRLDVQNHSGGAANCGLGFRYRNGIWRMGRLSADGLTYTDLTSSAQSSTATVTLQVTGANQTGWAIGCLKPMWWVSVNITTAETDAGGVAVPDHTVQYSQGGSWSSAVSVAMTDDFTLTNNVWTAVVRNFVWAPPTDWTPSVSLGGVPDGYYWLRFTSADREANDVAAVATGIECGRGYFRWQIANNGIIASEKMQMTEPDADGIVAYFSSANAGNLVYAEVYAG